MLSFVLALNMLAGSSPSLGGLEHKMAACEASFRADPSKYENARCLYSLERKHPKRGLKRISVLRLEFPDAPFLDLVEAHYARALNPTRAQQLYEKARDQFRAQGNTDGECVAIANLLSFHLRAGNNPRILEQLRALEKIENNARDPIARVRASVMIAGTKNANFRSIGEQYAKLRSYQKQYSATLPYSVRKLLLLYRGHAAFQHGDFELARGDAQALRELATPLQDIATLAQADRLAARVAIGRFNQDPNEVSRSEVLALLERSLSSARQMGGAVLEAAAHMGLASTLVGEPGRTQEGLAHADACLTRTGEQTPRMQGGCTVVKSQLYAATHPQKALALADQAVELMSGSASALDRVAAWRNLMQRAWAGAKLNEARVISDRAMAEIEKLRGEQSEVVSRRQVFSVWADDYAWLANRYLQTDELDASQRIAIAFGLAEKARARTLLDKRYVENSEGSVQQDGMVPQTSTPGALSQRNLRVDGSREITIASISQIQERLTSGEAMLAFQVSLERDANGESFGGVWAYIVTRDHVRTKNLALGRRRLQQLVQLLRGSLGTPAWESVLHRYQGELWTPLRSLIPPSVSSLVLVADGPLSLVPWDAVDDSLNYALTPSASHWVQVTSFRERIPQLQGLALLDPETSRDARGDFEEGFASSTSGLPRLRHAKREAKALKRWFGQSVEVLEGAGATKTRLFSDWTQTNNFLHISAHSVFGDPHAKAPQIALAREGSLESGWLTSSDIDKLDLKDSLVVLAGCATGWGHSVVGDGVLSLARAFQRAGATTVVASLWPIDDQHASRFFENFYGHLAAGQSVERAMASTKKTLLQQGMSEADVHGYVVLGDAKRRFQPKVSSFSWTGPLFAMFFFAGVALVFRRQN